jgi:prepilin-type N-terminal cleavage/methylation domain-containing protein
VVAVKALLHSEEGFTLAELMIVVGLLGFILAAGYAGMFVLNRGSATTGSQDKAAHDFADPLEQMSKILMQSYPIQLPVPRGDDHSLPSNSDYCIEAWSAVDGDPHPRLSAFYVDSAGELVWDLWVYRSDHSEPPISGPRRWVMSTNNANLTTNPHTPLFQYFDVKGDPITNPSYRVGGTKSMLITLVVKNSDGGTFKDTRRVMFRQK